MTKEMKIAEWFVNGRVGLSSKTMASIALGITPKEINHPHDPADLNRCLLLLDAAPEARDAFPAIAASSKAWAALIQNWDAIEATFLREVGFNWTHGNSAPETYRLMRNVLDAAYKMERSNP